MKTLALIIVLAVIWASGLAAFTARVAHSTPAADPPDADGVVALTGASSIRIEAAVQLLEDGKARRLLVSGVNPDVTRPELQEVAHDFGRAFSCCVDLGFRAANTQGNARETADWVASRGFHSLIVVTADYHMPRAILELQAAMPRIRLYPYPVATETLNAKRWWASGPAMKRTLVEYSKYLAILSREGVRRIGGNRPRGASAKAGA